MNAAPAIPVVTVASASDDNVANAHDELQIQRSEDGDVATASAAEATLSNNAADAVTLHHGQDPPSHCRSSPLPSPSQPTNELSSSALTVVQSRSHNRTVIPSSFNPSSWSKRRTRIASCGCLFSVTVCTIRLLLDPGPSAYVIHSIIILFDMILIHVFTHTAWLSIAGEITAVLFATCFHLTNQTMFELLETTLIAALVSFHMIKSRNEHWDREEGLERDVIGLQFYIEHAGGEGYAEVAEAEGGNCNAIAAFGRRQSSLSMVSDIEDSRRTNATNVEAGDDSEIDPTSDSFSTTMSYATDNKGKSITATARSDENKTWWHNFFDHFLDGSAGVMYTSFLGLIIDEIVNYGSSPPKT